MLTSWRGIWWRSRMWRSNGVIPICPDLHSKHLMAMSEFTRDCLDRTLAIGSAPPRWVAHYHIQQSLLSTPRLPLTQWSSFIVATTQIKIYVVLNAYRGCYWWVARVHIYDYSSGPKSYRALWEGQHITFNPHLRCFRLPWWSDKDLA